MSEISRKDIISDEALLAPALLAKNLEEPVKVIKMIFEESKKLNAVLTENSTSNKKTTESVQKLTQEQRELIKVQNKIAVSVAKNNDEYRKQEAELQKLKKELKEKVALGDKDALTINKQIASIDELGAALKKNQAAYAKLRTEEERNSKAGKELLKVIQQQDKEHKQLRGSMGVHTDKVGDYEGAMRKLKDELKAAQDEMVGIGRTLGTDSKEFVAAAEKAGLLKDEIGDLREATQAVAGSPIENLGGSLSTVAGKLKNLDFKGASDSARQFAQVSKTITFKEAISGAKNFGSTMGQVGKSLLTNPFFLIAAVIIGIGVAVYKLRDKLKPLTIAFDAVGDAVGWVVQQLKDFADWLGISSFAADEKAEKVVAAANKEIAAIQKRYDREIKIAEAAGKDVTDLEIKKWKDVIAEATKGMTELHAKRERDYGYLSEEDQEQWDAFVEIVADANTEIQVIENQSAEERRKKAEEAAKKRAEDEKKRREKEIADTLAFNQELAQMATKAAMDRYKAGEAQNEKNIQAYQQGIIKQLANTELTEDQRAKIIREADAHILELRKGYAVAALNEEIAALEESLIAVGFNAEEEQKIREKIHELKMRLTDEEYNGLQRNQKTDLEKTKEHLQKIQAIYNEFAQGIGTLFNSITENRIAGLDRELKSIDDTLKRQMELVGDNDEAKKILEERAEKRRQAIEKKKLQDQRKSAIYDKIISSIQAAIGVSLAVIEAGILTPLGIATGIAGGALIAGILAKQIPQYAVGTDNHPGGLAVVGEKGRELISTPSGGLSLSPGIPTLMNLPSGAEVFTNKETMNILAMSGMGDISSGGRQVVVVDNKEVVKAIKELEFPEPVDVVRISDDVFTVKKFKDGSVQYIRSKSINR